MRYLRFLSAIVISVFILAVLFTRIPFGAIAGLISGARLDFFFLSLFMATSSVFINALRWRVLLDRLDYRYGAGFVLRWTFMTFFFNVYLPGGVAGDIMRSAFLPAGKSKHDRQDHISRITASVVTDRIAGILGLMFLAAAGLIFYYRLLSNSRVLLPVFGIAAAGVFCVFLLLFSRRFQSLVKGVFASPLKALEPLKGPLSNVRESLFIYRKKYTVFYTVICLSVLSHLCVVLSFFLIARSLGVKIGFLKLLLFVPLIEFISAIPLSFGGAGIRETATIFLFSSEGVTAPEAMSVSLLSFFIILLLGASGGVLFLIGRRAERRG